MAGRVNGNGNGTSRLQLIATLGALSLAIIGAGIAGTIWLLNLNSRVGVVENIASATSASLIAIRERADRLDERLQQQQLATTRSNACETFARIETQFGTAETVINEMRVDELRARGIIWPALFGQAYPPQFYEIKIPHDVPPC